MEREGIKHSSDKSPYFTVLVKQFPKALNAVISRSMYGQKKYNLGGDWNNWKRVPNAEEEYSNALLRHLFKEGEDTELEHDIAVAWNALARLELTIERKERENNERHRNQSE